MDIELEDKPGGGLAVMVRPIAELETNILSETFAIAFSSNSRRRR